MTSKKYYTIAPTEKMGYAIKYSGWGTIYDDIGPSYAETEFDTYEAALAAAKKTAAKKKEDVVIYSTDTVVKFPEPDLEIEKLV